MFDKIFDMDNGFWRTMNRVADIFILNILFIVCSIPIITIGASATALYTVTLRIARDEESYIVKGFWKAFKDNFKQSTIIWLILLLVGAFIGVDLYLTAVVESSLMNTLKYVFYFITFLYVITLSFVFPIQSRFDNTIKNTIKNALFMGIAHFLPWTILIVVLNVLPILLALYFTTIFLAIGIPIFLLCGFGAIAFFNSKMFDRIFKKYIPSEETDESLSEEEGLSETVSDILESKNIIQRLNAMDESEKESENN